MARPCPICREPAGEVFLDAGETPVLLNLLCQDPGAARALPRGRIHLALCKCGLIRNIAFDPDLVLYGGTYENALHFSPTFFSFMADVARGLVERHRLGGRRVVEIGCGDGSFLAALLGAGAGEALGFDPAHDAERAALPKGLPLTIRTGVFSPEQAGRAGLLCCRHLLEHLGDPATLLDAARLALAPGGALYCEVPDSLPALRGEALWDLIYEHCLYFTAPSLKRLLESAGFAVVRINSLYGGQFLAAEARAGSASGADCEPELEQFGRLAAALPARRAALLAHWEDLLDRACRPGERLVLWGAGSKGVCFLNTLDRDCTKIEAAVDVNPRKQGRFLAGTGHPILAPEELRRRPPGRVIVLNPVYADEIRGKLSELGCAAKIMAWDRAGVAG